MLREAIRAQRSPRGVIQLILCSGACGNDQTPLLSGVFCLMRPSGSFCGTGGRGQAGTKEITVCSLIKVTTAPSEEHMLLVLTHRQMSRNGQSHRNTFDSDQTRGSVDTCGCCCSTLEHIRAGEAGVYHKKLVMIRRPSSKA